MTTIQISLPDELVQDARDLGLLDSAALAELLQNEIRRRAFSDIFAISRKLTNSDDDPLPDSSVPPHPPHRRR